MAFEIEQLQAALTKWACDGCGGNGLPGGSYASTSDEPCPICKGSGLDPIAQGALGPDARHARAWTRDGDTITIPLKPDEADEDGGENSP